MKRGEREMTGPSPGAEGPKLEFAFELRLRFTRVQNIQAMPSGAGRGAVYVDSGEFHGPRLRGKAVPNSGGDYALFRPDGVLCLRRPLHAPGRRRNAHPAQQQGFSLGPPAATRCSACGRWRSPGGPAVDPGEYYLRATPTFEVETGRHDWLMRHVFVGIGERKADGNLVRYYTVS